MKKYPVKNSINFLTALVLASLAFLIVGCFAGHNSKMLVGDTSIEKGPKISFFLNLTRDDVPHTKIRLAKVEILRGDIWVGMASGIDIDSEKLGKGQIFLGRDVYPEGIYSQVRVTVDSAALVIRGKRVEVNIKRNTVELPFSQVINLGETDSHSVFISWDVDASISGIVMPQPAMAVRTSLSVPMVTHLAYVACPDIDTIYQVRTDKNWVLGSLGVPGRPTYVAADSAAKKLYVLTTEDSSIKIIDMSTNLLLDEISIPMAIAPNFMILNPEKTAAFVLDSKRNYLLKIDLQSKSLAAKVRVGQRPKYLLYLKDKERIAVSCPLEQAVYLLDTVNLQLIETINVSGSPQGLAVWNDLLYIADSSTNTVVIYDMDARKNLKTITVGFSPRRILTSDNNIYISNYLNGNLSLLTPGQFGISKEISAGKNPFEMATSALYRSLYVGDVGGKGISIIDTTSNRFVGKLNLDTAPLGIVVIN